MKRTASRQAYLRLAAVILLLLGTLSANAQYFMNVRQTDGTVSRYAVNRVDSVWFEDQSVPSGSTGTYEYVDLGLSVLWATCNVGATKPEEYGDYFAWGETEPYYETGYAQEDPQTHWLQDKFHGYDWRSYKYYDVSYIGYAEGNTLLYDYDVASVQWGGDWRMPTKTEQDELCTNCTWTWTTLNGVNGYRVTSKKTGYTDRSIFLPAAGFRDSTYLRSVGSMGRYWSKSINTGTDNFFAYAIVFSPEYSYLEHNCYRRYGLPVRPVCRVFDRVTGVHLSRTELGLSVGLTSTLRATLVPVSAPNKSVTWISSDNGIATVTSDGLVTAIAIGTATITVATVDGGYEASCVVTVIPTSSGVPEMIDLGLSVKWATFNVGATKPEDYGDYFAWGETEPYYEAGFAQENPQSHWLQGKLHGYDWPSYKYGSASDQLTKYCNDESSGLNYFTDNNSMLDSEDDVAHMQWGGDWRMPTEEEFEELENNCSWTWTTLNGVSGYRVTSNKSGYTDRSIFLPAVGCRYDTNLYLYDVGSDGYYWSSSLDTDEGPHCARSLYFHEYNYYVDYIGRVCGCSVRPVCP